MANVTLPAETSLSAYLSSSKDISILEEELQQLGCSDLSQCQQCFEYLVLLSILGEVLHFVDQPRLAPAPGPTPDQVKILCKVSCTMAYSRDPIACNDSMMLGTCPTAVECLSDSISHGRRTNFMRCRKVSFNAKRAEQMHTY